MPCHMLLLRQSILHAGLVFLLFTMLLCLLMWSAVNFPACPPACGLYFVFDAVVDMSFTYISHIAC